MNVTNSAVTRSLYTWSAAICGSSHIAKGMNCEDASGVSSDAAAGWYAISVADGHGDRSCTRSADGSRLAVQAALTVLSGLAPKVMGAESVRSAVLGYVGDVKEEIVRSWRRLCEEDVAANPLSPEECEILGRKEPAHSCHYLYGTTLLAALFVGDVLLVVQQGDGCCAVLDDGGDWSLPVESDSRCIGNVTTSLSSSDAIESMRDAILDFNQARIVTVILATDGVDKSLAGDDQLFGWLDGLIPLLSDVASAQAGDGVISGYLAELCEKGCGDDASIALLADREGLTPGLAGLAAQRHRDFKLQVKKDDITARLVSMQRKHDHLEGLWNAGKLEESQEYPTYHSDYLELKAELERLEGLSSSESTTDDSQEQLSGDPNDGLSEMPIRVDMPPMQVDVPGAAYRESNSARRGMRKLSRRAKKRVAIVSAIACIAILLGVSLALLSRGFSDPTITFDGNEATDGSMESITLSSSEDPTYLPECSFVREGYRFVGWGVTADDKEPMGSGEPLTASEDTTYYAIWSAEVQFDGNGADGDGAPVIAYCDTEGTVVLPQCPFWRNDYYFVGWGNTVDDANPLAVGTVVDVGNTPKTFYAIWQIRELF